MEVDAELVWERGENKLKISTRVFFVALPGASNVSGKKASAISEFKSWGSTTPYNVFGGQEVKVEVEANEVSIPMDAITVVLASPTGRSMSWGGVTQTLPFPLQTSNLVSTVTHVLDWKPDTPKVIFMGNDDDIAETDEVFSYQGVARHEFGHSLGLGDAYKPIPNLWPIYGGEGVDPNNPALSDYDIQSNGLPKLAMNLNTEATDIEIEMVILAFYTGNRQNFGKQAYYQEISQAILEAAK